MNLKQLKAVLKKIDFKNGGLVNDPAYPNSWIKNITAFNRLLTQIQKLPVLREQIDYFNNSIIVKTDQDNLLIKAEQAIALHNNSQTLISGLSILLTALDQLVPADDANSVIIKLPDPIDFKQAIDFQNQFFTAISQNIVNSEIGGKVVLKEWEPGSFWLTLFLGTSAAVNLVAQLAWSAAVVLKKFQEYKILEEQTKSLKIKNEALDEIKCGIEEQMKLTLESEAKALQVHNFKKSDNHEQIERLKMGIKTFMELIDKGAEIHPALSAPESVKNLFPDFKKLSSVESRTKLLTETATDQSKGTS
jgi:hypothetical protein